MIINKIYDFLILHFIEPLSKINNFPNIIQGIGLALLTILIPLAIAVLADVYQKRKEDEYLIKQGDGSLFENPLLSLAR